MGLSSRFDFLDHHAGRSAFGGHALRHRLSLHRQGETRPFAWFDDLPLPVNGVAFHPTAPIVAIGAGSYDGGYAFHGDLVLWNWAEGTTRRPFSHLPEVVHLAFNADGGLDLLFRPWTDDWGQGLADDEAVLYALTLDAAGFDATTTQPSLDPERYVVLDHPEVYEPDYPQVRRRTAEYLGVAPFTPSRPVWSVGWFDDRTVGWITGERALDLFDLDTGLARAIDGEDGEVGQAIVMADRPLVQTIQRWTAPNGWPELQTRLLALNETAFSEIARRPYTFNLAGSSCGAVLGRQVRKPGQAGQDFVRDQTGQDTEADLGPYDPNRDYLGVGGAPDLYILRAAAPPQDERQQVCRVSPAGDIEPLWPLLSDAHQASQATECCASYVEDHAGAGLIVSGLYAPRPTSDRGFLFRRTLEGRDLWSLPINAAATAIVWAPRRGLVVAAFLDGRLMLIQAATGRIEIEGRATVEGAPAVLYSLAASADGSLVAGTMAGQVLVTSIEALVENNGLIELG